MAANGVTNGDTIQHTVAAAGTTIKAGGPVSIGKLLGISHNELKAGQTGTVEIVGVWNIAKTNVAMAKGDLLNWDNSESELVKVAAAAAGDITACAVCWKAAIAGDATVAARLSPGSGT